MITLLTLNTYGLLGGPSWSDFLVTCFSLCLKGSYFRYQHTKVPDT
jgi:hypothetical protein